MLICIYLTFTDTSYAICVFIIVQLPDDGRYRQTKHLRT